MKLLIAIFILYSGLVQAAPVLSSNLAADGTLITIWPDHKDPDQFYFAPNMMTLSQNEDLTPKFHFMQFKKNCRRSKLLKWICDYKAMMTSVFVAGFDNEQLQKAQNGIRKIRPNARFSTIPFLDSQVEFDTALKDFVSSYDCTPIGGQIRDEVPCTIVLNQNGIEHIMPFLASGATLPIKFLYRISGVIEMADGKYMDQTGRYGLIVNLGGEILKGQQDLTAPFLWSK